MALHLHFPRIKLRIKFTLLLVSIALVPFASAMLITIARLQDIQRDNTIQLNSKTAQTAAEGVSSFVRLQFTVLESIGTILPEYSLNLTGQEALLERVLYTNDNFVEIAITDAQGREIVREHILKVITKSDFADRSGSDEFLAVRAKGIYLGPIFIADGRPYFVIGKAIYAVEGTFVGTVFAQVDARVMQDVVKRISSAGKQEYAYIVNKDGVAVAHPDISEVLAERDFSHIPAVRVLTANDAAIDPFLSYRNKLGEEVQEVLGAGVPVTFSLRGGEHEEKFETGWFVIVERQAVVALAAVVAMTRFALFVLAGVLLIAITAAFIFAARIVTPIEQVHTASKTFGAGNFSHRVAIHTNDEIEDLASGFNAMADSIADSIITLQRDREVIAAERNKMELAIAGITDAVIGVDLEYRVVIFNGAAQRLTGYSAQEALGIPIGQLLRIFDGPSELKPEAYCPMGGEGLEKGVFHRNMLRMIGNNNREAIVNSIAEYVKGGEAVSLGCVLTLHDVGREQMIEKMKSEFVSLAAHQLRTPLAAIKWSTKMLLDGDIGGISDEQRGFVEKTYASIQRMIALINDLLNVARIEEGRYAINLIPADLGAIMQVVIDQEEITIKNKRLSVVFAAPKEKLPLVRVDEEKIKLALQNILENAIRYTFPGGKVTVSLRQAPNEVIISMQDTGIGISKKEQEKIFTKFFRGENVIKLETEGSGLGLFIAKNIVEAHGGKLWFESKEGVGSTFTFSLPLKATEEV